MEASKFTIEGRVHGDVDSAPVELKVFLVHHDALRVQKVKEAEVDDLGRFRLEISPDDVERIYRPHHDEFFSFQVVDASTRRVLLHTERSIIWRPSDGNKKVSLNLSAKHDGASSVTLDDLWGAAGRRPSANLQKWLDAHDVMTIADARRVAAFPRAVEDAPDRDSVRLLTSAAALSVIEAPVGVYVRLANGGIRDARAVADAPPTELKEILKGEAAESEVIRIQAEAARADWQAANWVIRYRLTGSANAQTNGFDDLIQLRCRCECASAVSAQAYLAHLLRVATRTLRYQGQSIDVGFLQSRFHQPFRDLPATCESSEKKIAQSRIAVEVLRKHSNISTSPFWYLEAAYLGCLEFLGLTYDELRTAFASQDRGVKTKLVRSKGLGIDSPNDWQIVDDVFRDLAAGSANAPTEDWLQVYFGLRSTLIDPLAPDELSPRALEVWQRALRARWISEDTSTDRPLVELPVIDPHIVEEIDLSNRTATNPRIDNVVAWTPIDFLSRRQEEWRRVESEMGVYFTPVTTATPAQRLKQMLAEWSQPVFAMSMPPSTIPLPTLGFRVGTEALDYPRLETMSTALKNGTDASADLSLFNVDAETVNLLVDHIKLVESGQPVTQAETDRFKLAILAHIKRAFRPQWLAQERQNATGGGQLFLDPQIFRIRVRSGDAPDPEWMARRQLGEAYERALWEELLRDRTRQLDDILRELERIVIGIESRLLPELRNWLVGLTPPAGAYTKQKAEQLTDSFQLDFEAGSCQRTTRVTQAIQTLQGLLFGARNGLLNDTAWSLLEPDFDSLWRWIGTYDAWRAAIMAFLHPERLLRPSFLLDMSPGFAQALQILRNADPISQSDAARAHDAFAEYLNDVAALELEASASRTLVTGPGGVERNAEYLLARPKGPNSGNVYWSVALEQFDDKGDQSWWRRASNMKVDWIFGLAIAADFLVAITGSSEGRSKRLEAWRNPLAPASLSPALFLDESSAWEGPFYLTLPDNLTTYETVTVRADAGGGPPTIVIDADETKLYMRPLNADVNGWAGRFRSQTKTPVWKELGESIITPGNGATFACRNNGLPPDTIDEPRWVFAVDVDNDGADELVAFKNEKGFWGMKLFIVGSRSTWLPLGDRGTAELDCEITARTPGGGFIRFALAGDFDGDQAAEIVMIIDTAAYVGPQNYEFTIDGQKWTPSGSGPGRWAFMGELEYPHPTLVPLDGFVGRFTQTARDEIAVTFYSATTNRMSEIVIFGFVGGVWKVVSTTSLSAITGANVSADSRACVGRFSGQPRHQMLLQVTGINSGVFMTLGYDTAARAWTNSGNLNVGTVSTLTGLPNTWMMAGDFDGDGREEFVIADAGPLVRFFRRDGQQWISAGQVDVGDPVIAWASGDIDGDGSLQIVAATTGNTFRGQVIRWNLDQDRPELSPQQVDLTKATGRDARGIVAGRFTRANQPDALATLGEGSTFYVLSRQPRVLTVPSTPRVQRFKPFLAEPFSIFAETTRHSEGPRPLMTRDRFRSINSAVFLANASNRPRNLSYLEEAFFFLVIEVALRLQMAGDYASALEWMQLVAKLKGSALDFGSAFLDLDEVGNLPERSDPVQDPLDGHAIARGRPGSYTRFVIESMARLLCAYADAEFTLATSESVPKARELYLSALALLKTHPYAASVDSCQSLIDGVLALLNAEPALRSLIPEVREALERQTDVLKLNELVARIREAISSSNSTQAIDKIRAAIQQADTPDGGGDEMTVGDRVGQEEGAAGIIHVRLIEIGEVPMAAGDSVSTSIDLRKFWNHRRQIPLPQYSFCIPPSSSLIELKRRIELNLQRLRNCQDITGHELILVPIGQQAEASPANRLLSVTGLQPLPYRYVTLIERSKQLVELARQIESSMLGFVEAAERMRYNVLSARRDLGLARASERLRAVQVQQAVEEVGLATLQRNRAQDQVDRYWRLLKQGLNVWEETGLFAQWGTYSLKQLAAISTLVENVSFKGWVEGIITWGAGNTRAVVSAQAEAMGALSQALFTQGEFERRQQSWMFGLQEATRDREIGEQQIRISSVRLRAAETEEFISGLQTEYASDALTLLTTKSFANEALYEWMASVLESIYRFMLQQATTMARLAEIQLAFERQEVPPDVIKRDYWTPQRSEATPDITSIPNGSDSLKGLTGAARLLRDIYQLDQFAFTRNKRKQQLTEVISLSRFDPVAFEQLRRAGRMAFDTPMELFDSRSPGHYLRLIHRVRLTMIALIPPTDGIRVTLSNTGISTVTVPTADSFRDVTLQRGFDQVLFTGNSNSAGQFEMDAQPELLAHFEGGGVATRWFLEIPAAANTLDFGSLADVIVTIEYTALFDAYLKAKTIKGMSPVVSRERVFSMRYEFPDAWYELHNPDLDATPLETEFKITRGDFPPNIANPRMTQISLSVRQKNGAATALDIAFLGFAIEGSTNFVGGASQTDATGISSTRRTNGSAWLPIVTAPNNGVTSGTWRLQFDPTHRPLFVGQEIEDILLGISFEGTRPAWT
jgi:hypothetical protein